MFLSPLEFNLVYVWFTPEVSLRGFFFCFYVIPVSFIPAQGQQASRRAAGP
jgi:hypothetical protein